MFLILRVLLHPLSLLNRLINMTGLQEGEETASSLCSANLHLR